MKRFLCAALGTLIALSAVAPALAEGYVSKGESVYALLNADGSVQKQIVSVWLHADDGVRSIKDRTSLTNIVDLKENVKPDLHGETLRWNSDEKDLYYQGNTDNEMPVTLEISYFLDGQPIKASELAGKTGQVEIHLRTVNHYARTQAIDGDERTVAPLFLTTILIDMPVEHFSNIKAPDGTLLNESTNQLVAFIAVPGLSESFKGIREEDLKQITDKLKEEFTVSAYATDFELPPIMAAVANDSSLLDEETGVRQDLDDMLSDLDDLTEATDDLTDGTGRLSDAGSEFNAGMATFKRKFKDFLEGVKTARQGADSLNVGAQTLYGGLAQLNSRLSQMSGMIDAGQLAALKQLATVLPSITLSDKDRKAIECLPAMVSAIPGDIADAIMASLNSLNGAVESKGTAQVGATVPAGDLEAAAADAGSQAGDSEAAAADAGSQAGDSEAAAADAGSQAGDSEAAAADAGSQAGDSEAAAADAGSQSGDLEAASADAGSANPVSSDVGASCSPETEGGEPRGATSDALQASGVQDSSVQESKSTGASEPAAKEAEPKQDAQADEGGNAESLSVHWDHDQLLSAISRPHYVTLSSRLAAKETSGGAMFTSEQMAVINQVVGAVQNKAESQIASSMGPVLTDLNGLLDSYDEAMAQLAQIDDLDTLLATASELPDILLQLENGVGALTAGAQSLSSGAGNLSAGMAALETGAFTIQSAISQFKSATQQLKGKTRELADGAQEFKDKGIDELTDRLTGLLDDTKEALDIKDAIVSLTEGFTTYTGAPQGASTSVKFLLKTPDIKPEKAEVNQTGDKSQAPQSFWDRIMNLF